MFLLFILDRTLQLLYNGGKNHWNNNINPVDMKVQNLENSLSSVRNVNDDNFKQFTISSSGKLVKPSHVENQVSSF